MFDGIAENECRKTELENAISFTKFLLILSTISF